MRQLLALAFASCFVKNWKYNQFPQKLWTISFELVCKPSFTCLERNEEMKEVVFSRISIYHIEGDIEIHLYQFVIKLKSGRFYSAPLKCFLISNFVNSFGEREILIFKFLRFTGTIFFLLFSLPLIFLNVIKKFIKHINMSLVTHISIVFDMSHSYASVHLSCIIWPIFAICIVPVSRPPLYR